MKRKKDFSQAFGRPDAAFEHNIEQTLYALMAREREGEKIMKRKLGLSAVAVLTAALILATVAFAAASQLGILDFIVGGKGIKTLPNAADMILTDIEQSGGDTGDAQFTVREAIFDGSHFYLTVAIRAHDEKTLLLGMDSLPEYPISDMIGPREDGMAFPGTIAGYALENGYDTLLRTGLSEISGGELTALDFSMEPDGTLVYIVYGVYPGDAAEVEMELGCLTCAFTQEGEPDIGARRTASLRFTAAATGPALSASAAEPRDFAECGVRVDGVELVATPLAVYMEVRYSVIDADAFAALDGWLWFEMLGQGGDGLDFGAYPGGDIRPANDEGTSFVQTQSLGAMEELPQSIVLRAFNAATGERYAEQTFQMK